MMTKRVVLLFGLALSACSRGDGPASSPASARDEARTPLQIAYRRTAEAQFIDLVIAGDEAVLRYFPEAVAAARCARSVAQEPCWTERDLVTRRARLEEFERERLYGLVA